VPNEQSSQSEQLSSLFHKSTSTKKCTILYFVCSFHVNSFILTHVNTLFWKIQEVQDILKNTGIYRTRQKIQEIQDKLGALLIASIFFFRIVKTYIWMMVFRLNNASKKFDSSAPQTIWRAYINCLPVISPSLSSRAKWKRNSEHTDMDTDL